MADLRAPGSKFFDFFHLDLYFPISIRIYHFLSIKEIINLSRTCRSLRDIYKDLLPLQWDVDKILRYGKLNLLSTSAQVTKCSDQSSINMILTLRPLAYLMNSHYISEPKRFRFLMARSNALVGGAVPLDFFGRTFRVSKDLNLFIDGFKASVEVDELLEYLRKDGYNYTKSSADEVKFPSFIYTAIRPHDEMRIVVRWTDGCSPVKTILERYQFTPLANFFSWNKAYSLFPLYSFMYRKGLRRVSDEASQEDLEYFVQYSELDAITLDQAYQSKDLLIHDPSFHSHRRPGDEHTWIIPFSTSGIKIDTEKTRPDYVLEHQLFSFLSSTDLTDPNPERFQNQYPYQADIYKTAVLRHTYTVGRDGWNSWLDQIAFYRMLEEVHKLPISFRPDYFEMIVSRPKAHWRNFAPFNKPPSWNYLDDDIPLLYEQWKTTCCHPGR